MYLSTTLAIASALAATTVKADSKFSRPPGAGPSGDYRDNPTYKVGEKLDVQWDSDLDRMDLRLWQDYPAAGEGSSFYYRLLDNTRSTSYIWDVSFMDFFSTNVSEGEQAVFYMALYEAGQDGFTTTSHYFNVSIPEDDSDKPTSTGPATNPTVDPTGEDPKTITVEPTATGGSDSDGGSSNSDDDSDLSTGAVAGIAVGATLGGIALVGALGFFLWRRRRASKAAVTGGNYAPTPQQTPGTAYAPTHGSVGSPYPPSSSAPYGSPPPQMEYYKPPSEGYQPSSGGYQPSEIGGTETMPPTELAGDNRTHAPQMHPNATGPGGLHEAP